MPYGHHELGCWVYVRRPPLEGGPYVHPPAHRCTTYEAVRSLYDAMNSHTRTRGAHHLQTFEFFVPGDVVPCGRAGGVWGAGRYGGSLDAHKSGGLR